MSARGVRAGIGFTTENDRLVKGVVREIRRVKSQTGAKLDRDHHMR